MLAKAPRRLPRLVPPRSRHPAPACRRYKSSGSQKPTPWKVDSTDEPSALGDEDFSKHTVFTLDFFKRAVKFSAIGLLAVGGTTWTAFQAAHMWVEHSELAPESDAEARRWEWDLEAERWSGGLAGGTDPALGFTGRLAVRSAWIAQHWGTGSTSGVIASKAYSGKGGSGKGGVNAIEARLEYAQDFLNIAINAAMDKGDKLHPETLTELLTRHASIMERMGTREALFEARSEFERVWSRLPGKGLDAARVALKLGDLNQRLGDPEDAMAWWARTIQLTQGSNAGIISIPTPVPQNPPLSPLAQRVQISTLVSMSAFYATSGQLKQAKAVEEASLNLLRSIPTPPSLEAATPPEALQAMYILHRSSLLSIHLAEVLYALREKPRTSIEWLSRAADSSERVALALTGRPPVHPDAPQSNLPHPPSSEKPLISAYTTSPSMKRPARSLLRDARRTAAEAWSLMGILMEASETPESVDRALECYERALGWAGVAADRAGGIGKAGEGTLESEWKVLWDNYVRARDVVRKRSEP